MSLSEASQSFTKLKQTLQKKAPHMDVACARQSRRVKGQIEWSREERNYEHVFLYIQKGLGGSREHIKKIIKTIYNIQEGHRKFPLHILSFGQDDHDMEAMPKSYRLSSYKRSIIGDVEEIVGFEVPEFSKLEILEPQFDGKKPLKLGKRGLVLIFLKNNSSFEIGKEVKEKLKKHKHAYVIYLNENIMWQSFQAFNDMVVSNNTTEP